MECYTTHVEGQYFSFFQHFIAPALNLMPCLQARGTRDCNKCIKFKKGAYNCGNERKIYSPIQMCGIFEHRIFQFLYLPSCTTYPQCHPSANDFRLTSRRGSARHEIRKLKNNIKGNNITTKPKTTSNLQRDIPLYKIATPGLIFLVYPQNETEQSFYMEPKGKFESNSLEFTSCIEELIQRLGECNMAHQ